MRRLFFATSLGAALAAQQPAASSPRELAAWLPPQTLAVLELADGPATLAAFSRAIGPLPEEFAGTGGMLLALGDLFVRARLGVGVEDLVATLAPRQVLLALVPADAEPVPILLSRVDDEAAVRELLDKLGPAAAAEVVDGVLALAPDRALLRAFLAARPAAGASLLAQTDYLRHRPALEPGSGLRLYVDADALRQRAQQPSLWSRLDGGGRFLVGPIARALDATTRVDATLLLLPDGMRIEALLAGAPPADDPARSLLAHGAQQRAMLAPPPGTLLAVSLDRDLRALYEHPDRLLNEDDAAQAKAGLSILDTIFGIPFVDGVLGGLQQPFDLYVLPRAPGLETAPGAPKLRLPALGIVAGATGGKALRALERGAGLLALIQAQERRQQGKEPFRLRSEEVGPAKLHVFEPPDWEGIGAPPVELGLSPTLLLTRAHAVFATTRDGALALAELATAGVTQMVRGDLLALDGFAVADYLRRNLEVLAVDRVLQEGESPAQARQFLTNTAIALERMGLAELRWLPEADCSQLQIVARRER